jgi:hypothetical protein
MAHAQKPDFVFRRNGRVHLNRQGRQFSRLLAAEVCASAVVTLDTPCSEVMWRVLATHSIHQFPLHFPSLRHRVPPHFNWTLLNYGCGTTSHTFGVLLSGCTHTHVYCNLECIRLLSMRVLIYQTMTAGTLILRRRSTKGCLVWLLKVFYVKMVDLLWSWEARRTCACWLCCCLKCVVVSGFQGEILNFFYKKGVYSREQKHLPLTTGFIFDKVFSRKT